MLNKKEESPNFYLVNSPEDLANFRNIKQG